MFNKRERDFSPFFIQILPKWYQLLTDHNCIDEATWKQLQPVLRDSPTHNVLSRGITFTVLQSNEQSQLIFDNNRIAFTSKGDFLENIKEISIDVKIGNASMAHSPVSFWVKEGLEGYEIGITTPELGKKTIMAGDDKNLVKVTVLPYSLFGLPRFRFGIATPEDNAKKLQKYGWTPEEKSGELYDWHWPDQLEHKYFTAYYKYI